MKSPAVLLKIKSLDESINLTTTEGVGFEILESVYSSSYKLVVFSADQAPWNQIAQKPHLVDIQFSWGYSDNGVTVLCNPRKLFLKKLLLKNEGALFNVTIYAEDGMFKLKNRAPQKMYKQMSILKILQEIAKANGLKTDIKIPSGQLYTLSQAGMTDYDFIKTVLYPRSVLNTPMLFFMKEGATLTFTPRVMEKINMTFGWEQTPKNSLIHRLRSLITIDDSNFGTKAVSFDPLKVEKPYYYSFLANDLSSKKEKAYLPSDLQPVVKEQAARIENIVIETLGRDIDTELVNRVSWNPPLSMYRTAVFTDLVPQVEIGKAAYLEGKNLQNGAPTFDAGLHFIYSAYHMADQQQHMYSVVFLERRGQA